MQRGSASITVLRKRRLESSAARTMWPQAPRPHRRAAAVCRRHVGERRLVVLRMTGVQTRVGELDATGRVAVRRAAAAALRWLLDGLEALAEAGPEPWRPKNRSYVGLHTPDTDAVVLAVTDGALSRREGASDAPAAR
jgi:hypothetical protein